MKIIKIRQIGGRIVVKVRCDCGWCGEQVAICPQCGKGYDDTKMQQRIASKFELHGYQPDTKQSNKDGSPPKNP